MTIWVVSYNYDYDETIVAFETLEEAKQDIAKEFDTTRDPTDPFFWEEVDEIYSEGRWKGLKVVSIDGTKVTPYVPPSLVTKRCFKCHGADVTIRAAARWCVEKQDWEISKVTEIPAYCSQCGDVTTVINLGLAR